MLITLVRATAWGWRKVKCRNCIFLQVHGESVEGGRLVDTSAKYGVIIGATSLLRLTRIGVTG